MGVLQGRMGHKCGSREGLNIYLEEDGRITGFCFSCKTFEPDPLEGNPIDEKRLNKKPKSPEEIQKELDEIKEYPVAELKDRKIGKRTMEYFRCKVGLDPQHGEEVAFHYYPYDGIGKSHSIIEDEGYKTRMVEGKRIWSVGRMKHVWPFGWREAIATGSPRLYITEGEIDAMSLFATIMGHNQKSEKYAQNVPAVVSLPHGASAAGADIAKILPELKRFKEIVLVFDMDEAGKRAVEDVLKILPDAKVAKLPKKDVNECVLQGNTKALLAAVMFNAETPKNTRLVMAEDIFEASKKKPEFGIPWPFDSVTDLTRGIRFGETIYIGAAQKMGKSEVVNTLGAHLIKHGLKVMMAKPEEANTKTVKLMSGKMVGKVFHDPKIEYDDAEYEEALEMLRGKLTLINLYQHLGWETLRQDIIAAASIGVKAVFIDPITNLTNGMDTSVANVKLQEIAQELAALALDLNIVIFIFCHLRNPDNGPSHDRGGEVLTSQFAGSRAMGRSCNYMFGIEGNKDPSLPEDDRNIRTLVLLDDREFGEAGRTTLYWNRRNGLFKEIR